MKRTLFCTVLATLALAACVDSNRLTGQDLPNVGYDETGFVRFKSVETTPKSVRVTFDFRKYGIDLRGDEQDVYLPFTLMNDLYTDLSALQRQATDY